MANAQLYKCGLYVSLESQLPSSPPNQSRLGEPLAVFIRRTLESMGKYLRLGALAAWSFNPAEFNPWGATLVLPLLEVRFFISGDGDDFDCLFSTVGTK